MYKCITGERISALHRLIISFRFGHSGCYNSREMRHHVLRFFGCYSTTATLAVWWADRVHGVTIHWVTHTCPCCCILQASSPKRIKLSESTVTLICSHCWVQASGVYWRQSRWTIIRSGSTCTTVSRWPSAHTSVRACLSVTSNWLPSWTPLASDPSVHHHQLHPNQLRYDQAGADSHWHM